MTSVAQRIREKLAALAPEHVEVEDESALHAGHAGAAAGGGHYHLTIISGQFRDKPPTTRHRMIYAALGELMQRDIHALSIKAYTPEEF